MYLVELYTNELTENNKKGTQALLALRSFQVILYGIIKNRMMYICYKPINDNNCLGICNLQNHKSYYLKRKGNDYVLQIIVSEFNLKIIEKKTIPHQEDEELHLILQ